MSLQNDNINSGQSNKFRVIYSNFPNTDLKEVRTLYENFTRKVVLPSYTLELKQIQIKGNTILQPVSQKNNDLPELVITYKLDSKFMNYYNIHDFIQRIRYAVDLDKEFLYQNTIKTIDIVFLDNVNREQKIIRFTEALAVELSELELEFGESVNPEFDITFKYREVLLVDPVS